MKQRSHTTVDQLIGNFDTAVRTIFGKPLVSERADPALGLNEPQLSYAERKTAAGLMRINHAGEVSAQGLYAGQALTAKLPDVREKMERAALEENDHLAWCENRVTELGEKVSMLSPLWYVGSFGIGAIAGLAGDKWSLGFVAETEHQVVRHLNSHLQALPPQDNKSRAIVVQMREDEARHATVALENGGAPLPAPIKKLMEFTSKVMTTLAQRF